MFQNKYAYAYICFGRKPRRTWLAVENLALSPFACYYFLFQLKIICRVLRVKILTRNDFALSMVLYFSSHIRICAVTFCVMSERVTVNE